MSQNVKIRVLYRLFRTLSYPLLEAQWDLQFSARWVSSIEKMRCASRRQASHFEWRSQRGAFAPYLLQGYAVPKADLETPVEAVCETLL